MRLALIFNRTRPDTTGIYFEQACRLLGVAYQHWSLAELARIPNDYDVYFRIDHGDDYEVVWPQALRPAVFYAIDTHLRHSWRKIRRMAYDYDLVCCAQRRAAEALRGAMWLPLACEENPEEGNAALRLWDIAFVGTDGGVPRKFYLQALRERFPNSFIGAAPHTQLHAIYRQAKIGFNYAIANDVNMRLFEVLAAKTFLLTNAVTQNDLERLGFRDREHLVLYRKPHEVMSMIDYYLAHAEERERIAFAGWKLVHTQHTYRQRVITLLSIIGERLRLRLPSTIQHEVSGCGSS